MANTFVNLPALADDGDGAWVDVSAIGGLKTITVEPNGGVFSPFVTVECSNQDTPTIGYPLVTFQQAKDQTFTVACHWMRAVTSNYKGGGAPTVAVGGQQDTTTSAQLPVPLIDGQGTPVDVSALESLKTIQVAGKFGGTINILVSEDGGASYNNAFSFQGGPGTAFQTAVFVADFMRVERVGTPGVAPGQPVVWISATSGGGGGGGGGGVTVDSDGTPVVDPATILNFSSAFTVTDAGGGQANIGAAGSTILGVQTFQVSVLPGDPSNLTIPIPGPLQGGDFFIMAQMINFTDLLACAIAGQPLDPSATTFVLALSGDCSVGDSWVFIYVNDV